MTSEIRPVLLDPDNKPAPPEKGFPFSRVRNGLLTILLGFLIFLIGMRPDLFGLDRGRSIGLIQIFVILFGLGIMTWAAKVTLSTLWNGNKKTIVGDFGSRVMATGIVISGFAALADAFGLGTNPASNVLLGTLQSYGLMVGIAVICVGMLMMIKPKRLIKHDEQDQED